MRFRQAVEETPDVEYAYRLGLQAIRRRDRRRMSGGGTYGLAGSINLDDAVREIYPNAARWDYGIGLIVNQQDDRVVWVEVHPASSGSVNEVIGKLKWLKNWLNICAPRIKGLGKVQFRWIASGGIHILKGSPQARVLAKSGIRFPTKYLDLDKYECDSEIETP